MAFPYTCLASSSSTTKVSSSPSSQTSSKRSVRRRRFRLALIILSVGTAAFLIYRLQKPLITSISNHLESLISQVGILRGSLYLGVLNFFTVVLCFPANMGLMIASGALLGPLPAFIALFLSKTLAACTAFLLARNIFYGRVQRALATRPRLSSALAGAGRDAGWRFVLLMRLSPFPGFVLNYVLSLTGVTFFNYALATAIGIMPSIANLVLIGAAARDVGAQVAGTAAVNSSPIATVLRLATIGAMIVVSVMATRAARRVFAAGSEHTGQLEKGDEEAVMVTADTDLEDVENPADTALHSAQSTGSTSTTRTTNGGAMPSGA